MLSANRISETPPAELREEVLAILGAAGRAINVREIQARSELSDGTASLAAPLRELRQAGEIETGPPAFNDQGLRYRLAEANASACGNAESAPGPTAQPERTASIQARREPEPRTKPAAETSERPSSMRDRVLAVVRARHPNRLRRGEIAQRTGMGLRQTSSALHDLRKAGRVARFGAPGEHAAWGIAEPGAAAAAGEESSASASASPPPPADPSGQARYAYRSDGTLAIESTPGAAPVELSRQDTDRLYRYLHAIGSAVLAQGAP